jgi:hypothetical protein
MSNEELFKDPVGGYMNEITDMQQYDKVRLWEI